MDPFEESTRSATKLLKRKEIQFEREKVRNGMARKSSAGKSSGSLPRTKSEGSKRKNSTHVVQIRRMAHDLSNALEAILQAAYLLNQSKLDDNPRRWAQLIDSSSQEAARLNREIRKLLRALGEA